jgi:hypothetical protein
MLGPSHWLHEIFLPKRLGQHNVFIFQVFVGVLVLGCKNLKEKKSINGDLLLKPFKNKIIVCLFTTTRNKHQVDITQNIIF